MVIHPDRVPLRVEEDGSIRVADTRVRYYLVVEAFERGEAPETIVRMFPVLELADVYSVFAYYLRHREELRCWLAELDRAAEELRQRIEAAQEPRISTMRQRLREHAAKVLGQSDAAVGK